MSFRPAIFDYQIPAFDVAGFAQPLVECRHEIRKGRSRRTVQKPDHRHCLLLRDSPKRPRGDRATQELKHQLAASQSDHLRPHDSLARANSTPWL
jgi:hypothetical protein